MNVSIIKNVSGPSPFFDWTRKNFTSARTQSEQPRPKGNTGRIKTASTQGNSRDRDSGNRCDRDRIMHRALRNVGAIGRKGLHVVCQQ